MMMRTPKKDPTILFALTATNIDEAILLADAEARSCQCAYVFTIPGRRVVPSLFARLLVVVVLIVCCCCLLPGRLAGVVIVPKRSEEREMA